MALEIREFTTPGTSSFTVPQGVTSITVECIGGGGAGGYCEGYGFFKYPVFAGGGAGGSYSKKVLSVTPGNTYSVVVANSQSTSRTLNTGEIYGHSSFVSLSGTKLVEAKGGMCGMSVDLQFNIWNVIFYGTFDRNLSCVVYGTQGLGSTANNIGDIKYRGGHGGGFYIPDSNNVFQPFYCGGITEEQSYLDSKMGISFLKTCNPLYSGPGGGGAGATGPGIDAQICSSSIGGAGNSPGGKGGNGVSQGNPGNPGLTYGGGGAGAAIRKTVFGKRFGGAGAQGYVKISWETEDLTCRPLYTTAGCCPIAIGCNVYSNSSLTTPAPNGYYWDGTQCWIVLNGVIDSIGSCDTSTTTTTTTIAPGYYYTALQQECPSCNTLGSVTVYSPIPLTLGRYYSTGTAYSYNIITEISGPSYDIDLTGAASGTSCFSVCVT